MRTFVAINFPDSLKNEIRDIQNSLKPFVRSARWTAMNNFHLTIKFLGEIDDTEKESAVEAIRMACNVFKPFEIGFDRLGYFGSNENMRVVWIGMSKNPDELVLLQGEIEKCFKVQGFPPDEKGFKPHVTIGRDVIMSKKTDLSSFIINLDKLYVDKISLMLSENSGKGFHYTPIYQVVL